MVFRGRTSPHYGDLARALDEHRPDLVVLATPTESHAELTELTLLRSTARVLVEKPLVHDRAEVGAARLRSSWLTGASSKESCLVFGRSGVEVWIDHTAMTGFASREGELLASFGTDGRTGRKIAHYRPLCADLFSGRPDPVLGFDAAATITAIHQAVPQEP
ncbi:Gfo/Idh/MocA family oxidoreductase [Kitasatospora purpeofusca]|uniref:Gfo/Idh/MocA family oxidoreductase n=1 Tax=Kitasatospora purpeofusca TaxID=67352 RepID=UPI0038067066